MKKIGRGSLAISLITVLVIAWVIYAFRPKPVQVSVVEVSRGTLMEAIDEDGETRIREKFQVIAPMIAEKARIAIHPGDVVRTTTVLVELEPAPLDARRIRELTERIRGVERLQAEADAMVAAAQQSASQAAREEQRLSRLAADGVVPDEVAEKAEAEKVIQAEQERAARFRAQAAAYEVRTARAAILAADPDTGMKATLTLRSPINGRVLRVFHESQGVVAAGTALVEVGNPEQMEIVVDVLTSDAVRIRPGNRVIIDGWGGEKPLEARVRRVEPAGFTKISALGVEEKRVNVIADFVSDISTLGDGYRLDAHVVVWEGAATKVPRTAIFRGAKEWNIFVVENQRARIRLVRIGHLSADEAEVLEGLREGEQVIAHPSDQVRDGVRVRK